MTLMVDSPQSVSSGRAPRVARLVEAGVLLVCAMAYIATQITYPGALNCSRLAQVLLASLLIGGIASAAWLAWRGVSGAGLIVGFVTLWIATFGLGQAQRAESHVATQLTFTNAGDSVRGAELFVNGVDLGPMPVRIAKTDFERQVPRWDKPPWGFDDKVFIPSTRPQWESCFENDMRRWFEWEQPSMSSGKLYYQAKYAGEIGAAPGFGSGGNNRTAVGFVFPQRDRRLQLLLSKARLADYHVSADWFRAIETFDEDGWFALRKNGLQEPGMDDVLSQWAKWKYSLNDVHTAADAWDALERVCREADQTGVYETPSVGGRAVELLARQVDVDQLVRACSKVIAETGSANFVEWQMGQRLQFGTADVPEKLCFFGNNGDGSADGQGTFYGMGSNRGSALTPRKLVIAHALAEMWKDGIGHDKIQSEIGADLLAWHYDSGLTLPLELAAEIGGPQVDAFLLSRPWQRKVAGYDQGNTVFEFSGSDVNRWLYLLTLLDDPAGDAFRREHATEILEMADKMFQHNTIFWDSHWDFLVRDHELAWKFWPQFRDSFDKRLDANQKIRMQYTYLQKMNAPASAFIDLWKAEQPGWEAADQGFGVLRFNTPPERAVPIASALVDYFQQDPHAMDQIPEEGNRQALINLLKKIINPDEDFLAEISRHPAEKSTDAYYNHAGASIWLSGPGGLRPVVKKLADSPEPGLRFLSLRAIRGVATASNRRLLQKLLSDPDPSVQRDARSVDAELKALAVESPSELTSAGSATTQP